MLPTRGACHGVFLLVHSARSGTRRSVEEWVGFARTMPTVMAAALDLASLSAALLDSGLATIKEGRIAMHPHLDALGDAATDEVLAQIAVILLRSTQPPWLPAAMVGGEFRPEFVPSVVLKALEWLGGDLESLLKEVRQVRGEDDQFLAWLGSVGESLVVALERQNGSTVRQVSLISDHFGYDVEVAGPFRKLIEVKTTVLGRHHRFFLSRNEANRAAEYSGEWMIVRVVLKPEALVASVVKASHVELIHQLPASSIVATLPMDSVHCRWIDTVEVRAEGFAWMPYQPVTAIPENWSVAGADATFGRTFSGLP